MRQKTSVPSSGRGGYAGPSGLDQRLIGRGGWVVSLCRAVALVIAVLSCLDLIYALDLGIPNSSFNFTRGVCGWWGVWGGSDMLYRRFLRL